MCEAVGREVWVYPDGWNLHRYHATTQVEVDALADLLGVDLEAVMAGPWTVVARVSAAGQPCGHGAHLVVASKVRDVVLRVHRTDAHLESKAQVEARAEADRARWAARTTRPRLEVVEPCGPSAPEPARCDPPPRTPWADNKRVGSIYVEREPSGTYRVSLVSADGGEKPRQIQSSTGLLADELAGAIDLCARRLAAIAARSAAGGSGEATA